MGVVGAVFLLAVNRDLGRIHVQHDPLRRIEGFRPGDQFAVDARQPGEVLFRGQHVGLEGLQTGSQRRAAIPDLLRPHHAERRILRQPLGVVYVFVARHAAVDGLAQQIGQRELRVPPAPRIAQMPGDKTAQTQPLIQLAHQNQPTVGGDP